jgi:hypothetical protein
MGMTETLAHEPTAVPRFAAAGALVEAIIARDFDGVRATLDPDAVMQALVPRGLRQFTGAQQVAAAFAGWFGDATAYEPVDAVIGDIGPRLHMRWRFRVQAEKLGPGWFVVEQQVYADTDSAGRIVRVRLLCSGYCPESSAG